MPELRKDPISGHWVIIATERSVRPRDFSVARRPIQAKFCPFCPGNESATPGAVLERADSDGSWNVRVVPNAYPALKIEGTLNKRALGLYDTMNGVGAHEVIIETREHDQRLTDMEPGQVAEVLLAIQSRFLDLSNDRRFRYVVAFKNHGSAAGASLEHTHSQLIALPIVPIVVKNEMTGAQKYFDLRERCVYCDIISQELSSGGRIVHESREFVAIAPFAARFPFETWLLPRHHSSAFEDSSESVLQDCAQSLATVLKKLDVALGDPPYNFMIHTAPLHRGDIDFYHWHIEIIPTLTKVAGFEWGSGFHINPTPPESAAEFLRSVG